MTECCEIQKLTANLDPKSDDVMKHLMMIFISTYRILNASVYTTGERNEIDLFCTELATMNPTQPDFAERSKQMSSDLCQIAMRCVVRGLVH